ncbi:MAG: hypothetical protein ABR985_10030 [Methanotrichaceae archaeon]|jgi:hypothetical protein
MASVEIVKDKNIRELDDFIASLTEVEINELNTDEGGDEEPMPFEIFCQKESINLRK